MNPEFEKVFARLRAMLQKHRGSLTVTQDTAECFQLTGSRHPVHKTPFPIAWVQVNKGYVSFHHMGIYARPDLLAEASAKLKARMQGKSCFNFKAVDEPLFEELEQLTVKAFEIFRSGKLFSPSSNKTTKQ